MADSGDMLFIEMAVAKGHLTQHQGEEALDIEVATRHDGKSRRLLQDIVVEERWMTRQQIEEIQKQMADGSVKTGEIIGYRILAKIGHGGMGTIYKAERRETGEIVALKVLPRRMAQKKDFVERFLRESRAAAKLRSDYIVRAVDVGFSGGYYYFAMEYVEGESVDTTLSIDGTMDEPKALHIVRSIALALCDAEKAGLVHRDIKPGNIIVRPDGAAKLTDFGLARDVNDDSVTQAGVTLGTPNYMSPEQAMAMRSLDTRSDIYSLGVTFYHMITGAVPLSGDTSLLTMLKHLNEKPVTPVIRRPDISQGCNDVILKMLAKDRNQRYRTARDLVEDLDLVIAGEPPVHAESTRPETRQDPSNGAGSFAREVRRNSRVRWIKAGTAALLLAIAGLLLHFFVFSGGRDSSREGADAEADKPARAALANAEAFARQNPSQLARILERYDAVQKEHKTTPAVSDEARLLAAKARRDLNAAVESAFQEYNITAAELAGQDRFGEAMAVYDRFPTELRADAVAESIRQARQRLEQLARARLNELKVRAEAFLANGEPDAAKAAIDSARNFGLSDIEAEARQMLARILVEESAAGSEGERRIAERVLAATELVRRHVHSGRFDLATKELARQAGQADDEAVRTALAENRLVLADAAGAWDAVMRGLAALDPGSAVSVGETTAQFMGYDAGKNLVSLRTVRGETETMAPGLLPARALKQLAEKSGGPVKAADLAALFLARGDVAQAAAEIVRARTEGTVQEVLGRCERQLKMLRAGRDEVEAQNLLAAAVEQPGDHERVVQALWELVTEYAQTRCYTERREEIEGMLARAEAESITVDTLFAVHPVEQPDGSSKLVYEFDDADQARDWLTTWRGHSTGDWTVRPEHGELVAEGGSIYFKVPLRGTYSLEIKALDLRELSVEFDAPDPATSSRAGACSFNWKRVGADAVSTLLKDGKPLAPARMYPKFRMVGTLSISLRVESGKVTVWVGDAVAHRVPASAKAVDPDRAGYVVLGGFSGGARLTSAVIECKLDPDWLEKEFVEPLRQAKRDEARWRMTPFSPLDDGSDASPWSVLSGEWKFVEGYAIASRGAACVMTTGDAGWRDYAFVTKIQVGTEPGSVRLLFRWSGAPGGNTAQGYCVELPDGVDGNGKIVLNKVAGGRSEPLEEADVDLAGFEWHTMWVEARGPRIVVLIDGRPVLDVEDDAHVVGGVGLVSDRCGAQFSDIKVKLMK